MRTIVIFVFLLLLIGGVYAYLSSNKPSVIELPVTEETLETEPAQSEVTIVTINSVEIGDNETDFGVYVVLSTGERVKIAESDNPETIEVYFDIETYHESFISPNQQFVALQASRFEDSFVALYDVATKTLYEPEWGRVVGWTEDNLLQVDACDLSGEKCTYLISSNAESPWEFVERL